MGTKAEGGGDEMGIQAGGGADPDKSGGAANADMGREGGPDGDGKGSDNPRDPKAAGDKKKKGGDGKKKRKDGKKKKEGKGQKKGGDKAGKGDTAAYSQKGVEAHNIFRKIHKAPDMKNNEEMATQAEEYAKVLAASGKFEHSKGGKDGENLAMSCSSEKGKEMTAADATKAW